MSDFHFVDSTILIDLGTEAVDVNPTALDALGTVDRSNQTPSTGGIGNILRNLHTFIDVFGKRMDQSGSVDLYFGEKLKNTSTEEIDQAHLNLMSQFQNLLDVCRDIAIE